MADGFPRPEPQRCTIRPGRDGDAAGLIALIGACWGEYPGEPTDVAAEAPEIHAFASHLAERGGALWVADAAGLVVGTVAAYPAQDGWHLSRLYVAAAQRGTGLAAHLLGRAQDHARGAGATRLLLWSDVLFTRAHAFYEKHGFVRRGGLRALDNPAGSIEAGYAKPLAGRVAEELDVAAAQSAERALASLAGAALDRTYWRGVTKAVATGDTRLFAAWRDGVLAGTVQLASAGHRGELRTLLVAPGDRCRGVARTLLACAEAAAQRAGLRLVVQHAPADEHTDTLYRGLGWTAAGTIPGYRLTAEGQPQDVRIHYKPLS